MSATDFKMCPCCAVDHDNSDYRVFESGSILMYVAEKAGKLYPQDFDKRHEVNQWLFFQNAGVGPMQVPLAKPLSSYPKSAALHLLAHACVQLPRASRVCARAARGGSCMASLGLFQTVRHVQGQANHFVRFAPEKIGYGMNRYVNETKRLFEIMDTHLKDKEWLAAGEYTIAGALRFAFRLLLLCVRCPAGAQMLHAHSNAADP